MLEDGEEVLALEDAVFGEVGAVDGVVDLVNSVLSSDAGRVEHGCFVGFVGTTEFSKGCYCVVLSDFKYYARASRAEVVDHRDKLREHSLVNFKKLLS